MLTLVLLALWVGFQGRLGQRHVSVAFAIAHGHFPEPALLVADEIVVAWVTNTGRSSLTLEDPFVQFENAAGRLVKDYGVSWNQKGRLAAIASGTTAWLADGYEPGTRRSRFVFQYHEDGGPGIKALSRAFGVLPLKRLPKRLHDWLRRNGMVDGIVYGHYESPWIASPQGGSNGSQPFISETNRTPAAAASRRLEGVNP